ncbi:hypothetical protein L873DRAFT_1844226 [Choiromyces venosus 120613-1]|uniref:Enterotoxin n=1 Tax=Choiromyces venosus 120613-1 TaxID=1336337 RepID=A0A3N4JNH3_9PEZI|nr:hypothetical protein L873DRAFT_1844226 [Choiromyces venosus 120613-1]
MRRISHVAAWTALSLPLFSWAAAQARDDAPLTENSTSLEIRPTPTVQTAPGSVGFSTSTPEPQATFVTITTTRPNPTLPSHLSLPTSLFPSDDPVFAIINQSPARRTPITPGEAATVCKSPAWELKLSNWIFSNAHDWLELYTLKYKDSYEVRRHGLVGSIAYRYLGEPNFRCGIGMTQTCVAWCKDIVMAVEDLNEAKNVYFVLSSISHFTAVADLVHSGLDSAQGNVGLMAPKMAHTFFWWKETPDDQKRAVIMHFTLLGIQNIFKVMSPFIPWIQVLDKLSERLNSYESDLKRVKEDEHIAWLFMRTAHLLNVEWGWTMRNKKDVPTVAQERGFYIHATGFRGDRTDRYWRDDYGLQQGHWWNYKGQEWTPSKRSFWKVNNQVWRTPRGGDWNAMDKYTPDGWKRREDDNIEQGGNKIPPSHTEYTKLGYWQEKTKDFNDLVKWKEERDKDGSQMMVDAYKMGWSVFTGWIPEALMGINMWTAEPEHQDREPEFNGANLAMAIGKMTSDSRQGLKAGVANLMNPTNISETGKITDQITKNVFFKTLNAALKAQQVYITCTVDHRIRKDPSKNTGGTPAQSCKKDNTGPQDLKACVPYTAEEAARRGIGNSRDGGELACYMYKWAARGRTPRHHNEAPFGSDEWEQWGVSSADIITSSVRAHLLQLEDYELAKPLSAGTLQTAKSIAQPDTAGVFTIPVCVSRHSINAPIESFSLLSELNPHSGSKHLPCDCGFWGEDTERVWRDVGLWNQDPDHYRVTLCPRQTSSHTDDPLEKFVSGCRLGTKKSAGIRRFGTDSRCGVITWLLSELKKRGVPAELPEPLRLAIWCRIDKGWWSRLHECKGVTADTPWGSILDELDGIVRSVGEGDVGKDMTEGEFWKQIEETEPVEELLLKPFGIGPK